METQCAQVLEEFLTTPFPHVGVCTHGETDSVTVMRALGCGAGDAASHPATETRSGLDSP